MQDSVFQIQGFDVKCTMTIGVSSVQREGLDSPEDLFEAADKALYEAKRAGKNQIAIAELPD